MNVPFLASSTSGTRGQDETSSCCYGFMDCRKFAIWRGGGSNRLAWKTFCSICLLAEFSVYLYVVRHVPLLCLFGACSVTKLLIETWGQDTPTWVCPGGPVMFMVIYVGILPFIIGLDGLCRQNPDIHFAFQDMVGTALFFFGFTYSLVYELGRFRWKKRPENKGRLHTIDLASYCIHPNYFGDLFCYTGWTIVVGTTCSLSGPLGMIASFVFIVCPNSDAYLAERYWKEFPEYARKTATLFPFVHSTRVNQALGLIGLVLSMWLGGNCAEQCGYSTTNSTDITLG